MKELLFAAITSLSPVDIECVAKNVYFESRNQSHLGQMAVTHVVLNRVADDRYPDTPCEVVYQGPTHPSGFPKRHKCQFSWYCDGLSDVPINREMWLQSVDIAIQAISMYESGYDVTEGSTHYHTYRVYPNWRHSLTKTMQIDDHIFYRWE